MYLLPKYYLANSQKYLNLEHKQQRTNKNKHLRDVYNSPEGTIHYWGELIQFAMRFGSRCMLFGRKGIQAFFFFFFFKSDILLK